ncbi:leucine rich repeat, typical subtype-like protein [Naegleria gruberi]|uniref:Leucine rich repeat, typical subtype-like protein n=1 Tax=Naegleria gruberi TaxID=5762 RepID=D2VEI9_NAEGR|nr:leucine rich repeat, typical subtype-like protein [Naegleria gruberi]EFC44889.1 leucine rich repeat, typical subtype-like protein [Naegleria gruberi]|eukprot:XP_002677633.1 leucine rich repeat, typical subtype-like protein [Naegleria gruberi strain NEG-M]
MAQLTTYIPDDMIYCILEFIDSIDRIRVMRVSKTFFRISLSVPLSLDLSFKKRIGIQRLSLMLKSSKNHLLKLTSLNLSENNLTKEVIEALCNCDGFPNLKSLNLQNNMIHRTGASFLGTTSKFKQLEELNLNSCSIDDVAMRLISVNQDIAESLRSLSIRNNNVGNIGVKYLCSTMVHLTKLDISKNSAFMGGEAIVNISNKLSQLTDLSINDNPIGNVAELCKNLKNLTHLDLSNCKLNDNGLKEFAENSQLVNLRILNLRSNNISNIEPLAKCKHITELRMLCLSCNSIGESFESFIQVSRVSNPFPSLQVLDLSMCSITQEVAYKLTSSTILDKLKALNISGNNIGNAENAPRLQLISSAMTFSPNMIIQ